MISWIASFLTDRKQRVLVQDVVSDWVSVPSGVPQGSVLGRVLFCLAVDDLSPVCRNSVMIKYADDVSVLHFVREASDDNLQEEWNNIVSWSNSTNLPLNFSKCRVLDFVTSRSLSTKPVIVNQLDSETMFLSQVNHLPFLGVILSSDLRWNKHFELVIKKAAKRIYVIRNLRRGGCPPPLLWRSYVILIRSVLLYAFPCMCNAPQYLLDKFLFFERRVCRIINDANVCVPNIISAADTLCEHFFMKIAANDRHPLRDLFALRPTGRSTRQSNLLQRPLAKTKRFSKSFIRFCK